MTDILAKFNKQLRTFIKKLEVIIPSEEISNISLYTPLILDTSTIYIEYFYTNISSQYFTYIKTRDETFILKFDINILPSLPNRVNEISETFRNMWINELSDEYKKIIWEYFYVLSVLANKYYVK